MKEQLRNIWLDRLNSYTDSKVQINLVGYRQFSPINGHFGFSTSEKFDSAFSGQIVKNCQNNYKYEIEQTVKGEQDTFIRIGKPSRNTEFLSDLYDIGAWNTVCFYREIGENVEGFFFCTGSSEDAAQLLNSHNYIKHLVSYFDTDFSQLVTNESYRDGFVDWRSAIGAYPVLSPMELISIVAYLRGASSKKTAQLFDISPRTVETYINRSKEKLNLINKGEIIDYFMHDKSRLSQFEQVTIKYGL